ncbi:hypothetical protein J3B02_005497, partial [Coemansia erecta]
MGNIIVKDAWAIAERHNDDGSRDEVSLLRKINELLNNDRNMEGKIPNLLIGGVVKQTSSDGKIYDDNTDNVLFALNSNFLSEENIIFRVHKRLAMTPVGYNIQSVRSVDELIVVAADAMAAYSAIYERCGILHRDISTNNILLCRDDRTDTINGILIDYDCALQMETAKFPKIRPDMTGTLPFMSIGNLKNSSVERTVLDDWESIIYVLCWMGTIGINEEDQAKCKEMRVLEPTRPDIFKWRDGSNFEIADAKCTDMGLHKHFYNKIVSRFFFDSSYMPLKKLVTHLRFMLMENPMLSKKTHSTFVQTEDSLFDLREFYIRKDTREDYWDNICNDDEANPFVRRAACANNIAK